MKILRRLVLVPSLVLTLVSPTFGQEVESRLKALEETTKAQQEKIEEQQRLIDELKSSLGGGNAPTAAGTVAPPTPVVPGQTATPGPEGTTAKLTGIFGGSAMTNPYISLIVNTFFYGSNLSQKELDENGSRIRTFPWASTRGSRESRSCSSCAGRPYFSLYANIPVTEGAELEKPTSSSSLPAACRSRGSSRAASAASTPSIPMHGILPTSR
jgi:hypothetical protein